MVKVDLGGCVQHYGEVWVHVGLNVLGMHFSQPNVTKIFRGSWLILSAVCH